MKAPLFIALALLASPLIGAESAEMKAMRAKAEQGDAVAQYNLGVRFRTGVDVAKDEAEARAWYLKAAEQGHPVAQFDLGMMYFRGQGGEQDLVEAHAWWNISGAFGNAGARRNLAALERQMTDEQKDAALKLAQERLEKIQLAKGK